MKQYTREMLESMVLDELRPIAQELGIKRLSGKRKSELIDEILSNTPQEPQETAPKPKRARISSAGFNRVYSATSDGNAEKIDASSTTRTMQSTSDIDPMQNTAEPKPRQATFGNDLFAAAENAATANDTEKTSGKPSDELPDFLSEQIRSNAERNGLDDHVDFSTVQQTLQQHLNTEKKEAESGESQEQATAESKSREQVLEELNSQELIIIEDVPMTYSGSNFGFDDSNTSTATKFHRFKDNPPTVVQHDTQVNIRQQQQSEAEMIRQVMALPEAQIEGCGVLEVMPEGFGFLRSSDYNYLTSPDDIYVAPNQVRQWNLKTGDVVDVIVKIPRDNEKFFSLVDVKRINGLEPSRIRDRVAFEHLTPLFPDEKFTLCSRNGESLSRRIVDLFSPIGKGQRALIVAQPKTGKTLLMKDIANAIAENHPNTYLMMLLIDERPEEVTDMARTVKAEVIASTFDEPASHHVKIANIVLEKAKRMVECGHDVVIFLDSITRLARAYNTVAPASGKVLTGGVDANALQKPKRFFGAARNIENGGSLTIIATALIDTGSKMDEVIFEEFKGTGNMELQLDRNIANKRIYPAVNLTASSTRRDDLLQDSETINFMQQYRNHLADMNPVEAITFIVRQMNNTYNNQEFLLSANQ